MKLPARPARTKHVP